MIESTGFRVVVGAVALAAVAGAAIRLLAPFAVARLLYYPEPLPPGRTAPAAWGYEEAEEVRFEAADGARLHGWWFPAAGEGGGRRGAVLYFHGNAGHVASRGDVGRALARRGLGVLLVEYRGYGASEGEPSEAGLRADARGAWRWLASEQGTEAGRVVVFGNSLGATVAVGLAADMAGTGEPAAGLVLVGPFASTVAVARATWPWVPGALLDWERNRFDAVAWIPGVRSPVLFIRGARDAVIPRAASRALWEAAAEPRRWVEPPGVGHNDVFSSPATWDAIDRFLDEVLEDRTAGPTNRSGGGST